MLVSDFSLLFANESKRFSSGVWLKYIHLLEHHMNQNGMQRNPRMGMQQMGPPPNQRTPIMMSMPATGVLVLMPPGPWPALITTTSIPQQPQPQPKPLQQQPQVYHYEAPPTQPPQHTQQNVEADHQQQHLNNQDQQQMSHNSSNTNTSSAPNAPLANIKEKTPMCLVNELARYNKIQHQYRLTGEQGPAHKKIFTVTLKLGKEEYEAEGPSIKKAQHSAAAKALTKTEFKHPPPKTIINRPGNRQPIPGVVTPTVELNALATKRGERAVYVVESGAPPHQTGVLEGQWFKYSHKLISLSEQNLMDCSWKYGNRGCKGGWTWKALRYVRDNGGIDTEASYPYKGADFKCKYSFRNKGATVSKVIMLPKRERDLQVKVGSVGPMAVAIEMSYDFRFYASGVYNEPRCRRRLNHAVLAVGYVSKNGHDYWLVKNYWGTSWGEDGYILMSRNKNNQCGIASEMSYPII